MMFTPSMNDRLTITALALAAFLPLLAISPAKAATPAAACADQAATLRQEAALASPQDAARALRTVRLAMRICAEGNGFEAARKFAVARQQLGSGTQLAQSQTQPR
jgi:hypothetical protein